MIIIPLILSSLISGITNIGSGTNLGRLSFKTFGYYVMTSLFAIVTGLFLVNIIKPGIGADLNLSQTVEGLEEKQRTFREILIEIIPDNIFQAFNDNQMLSIIFFAILFGFFITKVDTRYRNTLKNAFNAIFEVMMKITMFVIKFTPFGIFGIVAKTVADQDNLADLVSSMGLYMGTVIAAPQLSLQTLVAVRNISRIRSTARIKPTPSRGKLTAVSITVIITSPAMGIAAAPMEANNAVITIINWFITVISTP